MTKKNLVNAMKAYVEHTLDSVPTDLISISQVPTVNKETGEVENVIKAEVEVPKGYDELSRCRFTVKVVNAPLTVTEAQLNDNDYDIIFKGLKVTFIDSKDNVYFKADSYEAKKVN